MTPGSGNFMVDAHEQQMTAQEKLNGVVKVRGDFELGNEYWEYSATVKIRNGEVWDTDIDYLKGYGPDQEPLDANEFIEDEAKRRAEGRADLSNLEEQ